ncbi:MAG: YcxB family protein [Flavobacteriales bacterium]
MTVTFKITQQNYLTFQLYLASKSQSISKKRKRTRLVVPILYSVFAISLFVLESPFLAAGFAAFAMLWFFFYPLWEKGKYVKYYQKIIQENHKSRIGVDIKIELQNDHLFTASGGTEAKISTSEIIEIVELKDLILIRLDVTQAFVIPKDQINELPAFIGELRELAKKLKVNYREELGWVWK